METKPLCIYSYEYRCEGPSDRNQARRNGSMASMSPLPSFSQISCMRVPVGASVQETRIDCGWSAVHPREIENLNYYNLRLPLRVP